MSKTPKPSNILLKERADPVWNLLPLVQQEKDVGRIEEKIAFLRRIVELGASGAGGTASDEAIPALLEGCGKPPSKVVPLTIEAFGLPQHLGIAENSQGTPSIDPLWKGQPLVPLSPLPALDGWRHVLDVERHNDNHYLVNWMQRNAEDRTPYVRFRFSPAYHAGESNLLPEKWSVAVEYSVGIRRENGLFSGDERLRISGSFYDGSDIGRTGFHDVSADFSITRHGGNNQLRFEFRNTQLMANGMQVTAKEGTLDMLTQEAAARAFMSTTGRHKPVTANELLLAATFPNYQGSPRLDENATMRALLTALQHVTFDDATPLGFQGFSHVYFDKNT